MTLGGSTTSRGGDGFCKDPEGENMAPCAAALQEMTATGGAWIEWNVSARIGAVGVGGWSGCRGRTPGRRKNRTGRSSRRHQRPLLL